jgi:hypothetical protein
MNVGGAIVQVQLMVARVKYEWSHLWIWNPQENKADLPRPMSNLLIPPGLVKPYHYVEGRRGDPHALTDPMTGSVGAHIKTERGVRRVLPEETGRGLGIPKEWRIEPKDMTQGWLNRTTSLFHWEYLAPTLSRPAFSPPDPISEPMTWEEFQQKVRPVDVSHVPFSWKPPDLAEGGKWHSA